jgi:hypothetical protein
MTAYFHRTKNLIARAAALAIVAAAFVAMSGLPAQAQVFNSYPAYNGCQTFSMGPFAYSSCNPYNTSYYSPYYYYGYPYYYYGGGGSVVDPGAPGEGGNGHP